MTEMFGFISGISMIIVMDMLFMQYHDYAERKLKLATIIASLSTIIWVYLKLIG